MSLGILKQKHMVKLLRLKVVGNHPSKINHIEKLSCNSPKKYRTHCLFKKAVVDLSHVNRERELGPDAAMVVRRCAVCRGFTGYRQAVLTRKQPLGCWRRMWGA
jgi:hypothetical protein